MRKLALVIAVAAVIDLAVGWVSCSDAPRAADVAVLAERATPLDLAAPYAAADYRFLDAAVGSASIVQLGESLHITDELPRVRTRFVRYLHEQLGFDTIALEGSLVQAWLAEDELAHAGDVERAQAIAWFPLWHTPAMRELMAYVASTRATSHPLYLASFNEEIGASAAYEGDEGVVTALFGALRGYAPPPPTANLADVQRGLAAIVRCGGDYPDLAEQRVEALAAVTALDAWVRAAVPQVAPPPHAAVLARIPGNFLAMADLCTRAEGMGEQWQELRDELNAASVLDLRDHVSTAHKIITWAHHSHVAYDSTHENVPSMGQHLRDRAGSGVYTIGTFAGGGRVITGELFGERDVPSIRQFGVERMLGAVGRDAYFVDVSRLPATDPQAGWRIEQTSRLETFFRRPTVLARDFDGAVFFAHVHPAYFIDGSAAHWLLWIWGFVLEHAVGFGLALAAGVLLGVRAIVRWLVRRIRAWRGTRAA